MKFIDMHAHIYPDSIAHKAAQSIRNFYRLDGEGMDGTASMLLQQGTEVGITKYLILPVAVKPEQVSSINHYIHSQTQAHGCFLGFGTVHAGMEDITAEAEGIAAMGLKGIKIHPDCQRFDIDDVRLYPLYEAVQGKLPMMIHMGDVQYSHSHPARLRRVLQLFPRLQVCAAHFGGHTMYETAREYLSDTTCIMDISSTLMFMENGQAEHYINHYGAERLAFGTDYPVWDPVCEVQRFLSLNITQEQREQIAYKTAERFLNL